MKRIALVAAAALLGTGCVVSSDSPPPPVQVGSVNLYWSFQKYAPAQGVGGHIDYDTTYQWPGHANTYCPESSVDSVTVDSPNGQVTVGCVHTNGVQGLGIDGIPEGTWTFRFRGWRGSYLVYDTTRTYDVHAGMTLDYYVAMQGVYEPLDLYGDLYNTSTSQYYADCAAAMPVGSAVAPYFGFEIRDFHGNLVETGTAGCALGLPAPVFVGDLDLDNYMVRVRGYRFEDDALVFDSCPTQLDHFVAQVYPTGEFTQVATNPVPISCP